MSEDNRKEESQKPLRKPFFIASDEGYIWSKDVHSIKANGDQRTYLKRENLNTGVVDVPVEVVRAVFEEHGYEFVSEGDLKKRTEDYLACKPKL